MSNKDNIGFIFQTVYVDDFFKKNIYKLQYEIKQMQQNKPNTRL